MSDKILDLFYELIDNVINHTQLWDIIKYIVLFLLALFLIFFVISLVKHAKNYAIGRGSGKQFIVRFLIGLITMGIMFMFLYNPGMFLNTSRRIATVTRDLFNDSINLTHKNDEVVYSTDDKSNQMAAVIWKTALFEPWCVGMFGDRYENIYTQYSDKPDKNKLDQSYAPDHENPPIEDGEDVFYDSAGSTGDVYVDLGATEVRNWGAFTLSTLSKYHIGMEQYGEEMDTSQVKAFPTALTTYRDKNIYADTFRWIDAKMNISPQYHLDEEKTVINTYAQSRPYETHVYKASWSMFWNTLMLLVMLPVVIKRLVAFLRLLLLMVQAIIYCLKEFIQEDGGLSKMWVTFKDSIITFIYASLQLYILIFLYEQFVGKTFLEVIIYIILVFIISAITPKDIYRSALNAKHRLSRKFG